MLLLQSFFVIRFWLSVFFILLCISYPSQAYSLSIVRDDEIEDALLALAKPVFKVAGLSSQEIKVRVINSPKLNAFVNDATHVYLYSGMILNSTPEMLVSVIAHELGHIAEGHIVKILQERDYARGYTMLSALGGIVAAVISGKPEGLIGPMIVNSEITHKHLMKFSREKEQAADKAAVAYLVALGLSPENLKSVLHMFNQNEKFFHHTNTYSQTHPLSKDRLEYVDKMINQLSKFGKTTAKTSFITDTLKKRYQFAIAKLSAFIKPPEETLKQYRTNNSIDSYAKAIAYYKMGEMKKSCSIIDKLIKEFQENSDSYFIETKAQFLYEKGMIKESIPYYEKAMKLRPHSALMHIQLGTALIKVYKYNEAIALLEAATHFEPENSEAFQQLGIAYSKANFKNESHLNLAKAALLREDIKSAEKFIDILKKSLHNQPESSLSSELYDLQHELTELQGS